MQVTGVFPAGQGGGNTDCGIPASAVGVHINIVAVAPLSIGNIVVTDAGGTPPSGGVVNYQTVSPSLNNSNAFNVPLSTSGALDVYANCGDNCISPTVHIRGIVIGYYTQSLADRVAALEALLADVTRDNGGPNGTDRLLFTGMNMQLVDGTGDTECSHANGGASEVCNGLGNLIIGYNEGSGSRTGAHSLVAGKFNDWTAYANVVFGESNSAEDDYATVSGGRANRAQGQSSAIAGGANNDATGSRSLVAGGNGNTASGVQTTAVGGLNNTASSSTCSDIIDGSTVVGGVGNNATGCYSAAFGGRENTSSHDASSVFGGRFNDASGEFSTVTGGDQNTASGFGSSVSGGGDNTASSVVSAVSGGVNNTASGQESTVSGGYDNTASGKASTVSGGQGNTASQGPGCTETWPASTVSGGRNNTASGCSSTVSGGSSRSATGGNDWVAGSLFETN